MKLTVYIQTHSCFFFFTGSANSGRAPSGLFSSALTQPAPARQTTPSAPLGTVPQVTITTTPTTAVTAQSQQPVAASGEGTPSVFTFFIKDN